MAPRSMTRPEYDFNRAILMACPYWLKADSEPAGARHNRCRMLADPAQASAEESATRAAALRPEPSQSLFLPLAPDLKMQRPDRPRSSHPSYPARARWIVLFLLSPRQGACSDNSRLPCTERP